MSTVGRSLGWRCALAVGLLSLAASAQAEDDRLSRVLPLCESPDPLARRFCIEEISAMGDPERRARARLMEMASHDDDIGRLAAEAIRVLYGEVPPLAPPRVRAKPTARRWPADPGTTRTIFFPSAFTRPRGQASWTIFDAGHWTFDYGASDQMEIGIQTGPPIGAFLVAPQFKAALHGQSGSLALFAFGGAFIPVVEDLETVLFYGGGPIITVGNRERFANFGMQAYALSADNDSVSFLLPNFGGSVRLARRVRASVEILVPDVLGDDLGDDLDPGDLIVVIYGLRLIGQRVWGDIAFALPACDGCGEITEVLPLGLPLLGLGLSW